MICFIDMDGVLSDFVAGVCAAHNRPDPYANRKPDIFDMEKIWGLSVADFWKPTNSLEFWLDLPKMPDGDAIMDVATSTFGIENICVLTAPSKDAGCVPGKRQWINQHYPQVGKRIL